ncbi:transposase [Pedobacter sp. SL55]|uniref:transposase n=1 Tax=Pedobacter sp. SL55 TaxID=2995161 RepID=UPI0022707A93|nr:transposase [Pedobacter sp. SL55]WAC41655.1 hypothetical protein OVA16_04640 [Pedobacter sp. SL55]
MGNDEMVLIEKGKIAEGCWSQIPEHFPSVVLHEFVIMPNHIHGSVEIVWTKHQPSDETVGAKNLSPENQTDQNDRAKYFPPQPGTSKTVGSIVRGFKISVTKWVWQNTEIQHLWQRDDYEHIIRKERAYHNISRYIQNNPLNWGEDKFTIKASSNSWQ